MIGVRVVATLEQTCGRDASWVCETVYDRTGSDPWSRAADWLVSIPLKILLIVLVAIVVNRVVRRLIKRSMHRIIEPKHQRATKARRAIRQATPDLLLRSAEVNLRTEARVRTLTTVFRSLASVAVWFCAGVAILETLNINLAPLVAGASIIGVALGFGAQNIVRDFLAGTFMVVEDQFGVGDIVDIGEAKGTVEQITLRATRIRDVNGTLWHVPNGQIQRVANKSQEWARAVLDLDIDATTDYEEAASLIQSVAEALAAEPDWMAEIISSPEVWGIENFTKDGYTIRLVLKTRPAAQFAVMRELRIRLLAAFIEHGVVTPGARTDIWIHEAPNDPAPDDPAPDVDPRSSAVPAVAPATDRPAPIDHPPRGDPSETGG